MNSLLKIELHCHLDGSLRPNTVLELAKINGIELTESQKRDINELLIAPEDCDSLDTYLKRFELPISVMQTKEALERVTYELMEDAAREQVKYIEIRFAPQLHIQQGLSLEDIISSVVSGLKKAESTFDIRGNIILSYLRNTKVEDFYAVINAGEKWLKKGVVAVDLCGGERDDFSQRFVESIHYAKRLGYHVTIHAGETGIVRNIVEAIELLGAERIGHGVAMMQHPDVIERVKARGVAVECCPSSNVQTKAVQDISMHPVHFFKEQGVNISINTDNRTVSDTTMTVELQKVGDVFEWSHEDIHALYQMSIDASFANDHVKTWLQSFQKKDL